MSTPKKRSDAPPNRAGQCCECGKPQFLLMPLHGDKGGPMMCILCALSAELAVTVEEHERQQRELEAWVRKVLRPAA